VRLAGKDLAAVELSEGWRFTGRHDAALQADLLRLLHDADQVRASAVSSFWLSFSRIFSLQIKETTKESGFS
jgi:hypothetical protein